MPKRPYVPVDEQTSAWLQYRWAWLCREFGTRQISDRPIVLPTAEYFPDPYDAKPEHVETLLHRVARYMNIDPETLDLHYYEEKRSEMGRQTHGSVGMYRKSDQGKFEIWLEVSEIHHPERVIATMAHELGHVLLLGQERVSHDVEDHEPLTDLLTVFYGLGTFPANTSVNENYSLSGWSIGKQGYLSMNMFGYAFALFARTRQESNPSWLKNLRLDVRKACQQTLQSLPDDFDPLAAIRSPAAYPTARAASQSIAEETDLESSPENTEGLKVCTYCGTPIPAEDSSENSEINDGSLGICAACRDSIEEADSQIATPQQLKMAGMFDRFVLWFFLGLLALAVLSYFVGGAFR